MPEVEGASSERRALKTAVAHWVATNGRVVCDEDNGRPALMGAFRGVYVNYTEKQCSAALTVTKAWCDSWYCKSCRRRHIRQQIGKPDSQ